MLSTDVYQFIPGLFRKKWVERFIILRKLYDGYWRLILFKSSAAINKPLDFLTIKPNTSVCSDMILKHVLFIKTDDKEWLIDFRSDFNHNRWLNVIIECITKYNL